MFKYLEMSDSYGSFGVISRQSSNDLAHLGFKEMVRCCWLDIKSLGLISMLSVRCMRISASDGHFWRVAVRSLFPLHPFEVSVDGECCVIFTCIGFRIIIPACLWHQCTYIFTCAKPFFFFCTSSKNTVRRFAKYRHQTCYVVCALTCLSEIPTVYWAWPYFWWFWQYFWWFWPYVRKYRHWTKCQMI